MMLKGRGRTMSVRRGILWCKNYSRVSTCWRILKAEPFVCKFPQLNIQTLERSTEASKRYTHSYVLNKRTCIRHRYLYVEVSCFCVSEKKPYQMSASREGYHCSQSTKRQKLSDRPTVDFLITPPATLSPDPEEQQP
jgi:hypothetical protein